MIDFFSNKFKGKTYIFTLDPRIKFFSLLIIFTSLLLMKHITFTIFWFVIAVFILLSNKIGIRIILKPIKFFTWLFVLTLLFHSMLTPGKILLHFHKFFITTEGVMKGLLYSIRLFLIILFTYLFTLTTNPMDLTDGLARLFAPFEKIKVPISELFIITHITIRFIPTLFEQSKRILMAQKARGLNFNVNLIKRIKYISALIVPVIVLSIKRANSLALALEARWYEPQKRRTSYIEMKLNKVDFLTLTFLLLSAGGLFFCETLK